MRSARALPNIVRPQPIGTRRHHDAEEVVNWTFFLFWHYREKGGLPGNDRAFLRTICRNLAIDARRSQVRRDRSDTPGKCEFY